jgi:peptidoglycan/xylan/chitin deacetylase (PgdA/CDA1 family)
MRRMGALFGWSSIAVLLGIVLWLGYTRVSTCQAFLWFGPNLVRNPALLAEAGGTLPAGWHALAPGAVLRGPAIDGQGFDLDGDGRGLQLLGIANAATMPSIDVAVDTAYCISVRALSDARSATRARIRFDWLDPTDRVIRSALSPWQPVVRWTADAPPATWSTIAAVATAPSGARRLLAHIELASDDRVYLDMPIVRSGPWPLGQHIAAARVLAPPGVVRARPWPDGRQAAVSFSFDWETTMGGLVHSRSLDDPLADEDPVLRGLRMRRGVTTTMELFDVYDVRATYYANGYNFLDGNPDGRTFMGDPTFRWADTAGGWPNDIWLKTPWFAPDPLGTSASHPAWYFGDLIDPLRAAGHDVQSHTFSHLHGGLATLDEWRADLTAWREIAAERGVPPARSLAFPWSSSAGMTDAAWNALADAGITSVTRTHWSPAQPQYHLVSAAAAQCRPVPGHERITACPDFYLTEARAGLALEQLRHIIDVGGMTDFWAHTEEVVSDAQIAAWRMVVAAAANRRDLGQIWIAPLAEIADRAHAVAALTIEPLPAGADGAIRARITNASPADLPGLTLELPERVRQARCDGAILDAAAIRDRLVIIDLAAGQQCELNAWLP